jgi:CRISPR/Cas system CSM-associated protein Csm3 (group 7 of RAMP superfamily)
MPGVEISLTITMLTPLSIGAGGSSGTLADKSILRDGWGRPIIPGSHVKGKARHAAEALARALGWPVTDPMGEHDEDCVIQPIFGAPIRWPSPLRFNDLVLVEPLPDGATSPGRTDASGLRAEQLRPSVSINRRRGVAEDERLLVQETTAEGIVFANERAIVGVLDKESHLALLMAALRLTTRWGGAKSRGLGWASVEATAKFDGVEFGGERFADALRAWEGAR